MGLSTDTVDNNRKYDGVYYEGCSHTSSRTEKYRAKMLEKGKSFSQWCKDNNFLNVLNRWDYSLNKCTPDSITCYDNKKYWFKCSKHPEHKSELKKISNFTTGHVGTMNCKQCSSLAQWFIDNDMDISKYWDYEKNNEIDPWTLSTGNQRQKIWIKCQEKEYHGSYKTTSDCFTKGKRCPYCSGRNTLPKDSLGAYITNKYGKDFLERVWSNRNKNSPFELAVNSNKKVIWKCGDNLHKEYLRSCDKSVRYEFRCPECVKRRKESLIQEKTRIYLEMLGYTPLTEYKCTISPINPKTNHHMLYDNEIILSNREHLIIEVHGEQHYNSNYYKTINKCSDEEATKMLKQRKLYDRYKKAYAEHYNYNYLELPYWSFIGKNKELYKQMIDDKIEEILHNIKAS